MNAAFYMAPRKIDIGDIQEPKTPKDGLVIKVRTCAVCGSDLRRWRESPQDDCIKTVPGHEISGRVVEVGKNVSDYLTGDRVSVGPDVHCGKCYYCKRGFFNLCDNLIFYGITPGYHGGFAEYMQIPNDILTRGIIHKIPENLSYQDASLAEPCSSVIACHQLNGTTLGETVIVLGAGPIGCLHTLIARAHGARVIISEPNKNRRKLVEQFEPWHIVNPNAEDLLEIVKKVTKNVGADKVICANPVAETQQQAVEIVRKGGKIVLFGGLPKANPNTILNANTVHYGQIEVIGSFSYTPTDHAKALDYLSNGIIPADKIITAEFILKDMQEAYECADRGDALKVVVNMED